ncbi:MAG: hypothetical protein QM783_04850 [Phycisphaerales bacterium]
MRNTQRTWPRRRWWLWPAAWAAGWVLLWLVSSTLYISLNLGNYGAFSIGRGGFVLVWPVDDAEASLGQGTGPKAAGTVTVHRTWPWFGKRWYGTNRHPGGAMGELVEGWEKPLPPTLDVWPSFTRDWRNPFVAYAPFWMLGLISVVPVAAYLRRSGRYWRGRCPGCNYDRCGSFDVPCSECGTVVAVPVKRTGT